MMKAADFSTMWRRHASSQFGNFATELNFSSPNCPTGDRRRHTELLRSSK
jgi:hypothetical protein